MKIYGTNKINIKTYLIGNNIFSTSINIIHKKETNKQQDFLIS